AISNARIRRADDHPMRSPLLVVVAGLLLAGCGSAPAAPSTSAPGSAPKELTQPEQRYLTAITAAVPGARGKWSNAALVRHGYEACTALNADADNPEAAVAAVGIDVDDAAARAIVRAAADDLCPAANAAGLSPTAPASAPDVATSAGGGVAPGKPVKFIYRVLGNYRATQLKYTASNGDMVDLNHTNNIHTAGSALPWT